MSRCRLAGTEPVPIVANDGSVLHQQFFGRELGFLAHNLRHALHLGTYYFRLCDLDSPIYIIPYSLYAKIYIDIFPLEPTHKIIKHANKTYMEPFGILQNVNVIFGSFSYPIDLFFLGILEDDH